MFIRVIDFETTHEAPDSGGGVCEIGYCDLVATGFNLLNEPTEWSVGDPVSLLVNPGCPIPPETSAIHHLIDEDVRDREDWKHALRTILNNAERLGAIGIAAHSSKFEKLWCDVVGEDYWPTDVPWLCSYKLSLRLWPDAPRHSNMALRYWRKPGGLDREKALPAHRAGSDAYVTAFLLRDLFEQAAQEKTMTWEQAVQWSSQPALQVTCHIGKQRGMKWADIDDGFMRWLLDKDFDEDVLFTARYWLDKRQKEWEAERAAAQRQAEDDDGMPF